MKSSIIIAKGAFTELISFFESMGWQGWGIITVIIIILVMIYIQTEIMIRNTQKTAQWFDQISQKKNLKVRDIIKLIESCK